VSEIGPGIMAVVGFTHDDTEVDVEYLCPKLLNLRIWNDDQGKSWAKSAKDKDYQMLLVSQFTLYHQFKGAKPDFHAAMQADKAKVLYEYFLKKMAELYGKSDKIFPGAFGEKMQIEQVNDGPVTLTLDSIKEPKL
jgi:D-tyrosyl-tRNA(Tyr) deacylase